MNEQSDKPKDSLNCREVSYQRGGGWGMVEIGEGINSPPILMSTE